MTTRTLAVSLAFAAPFTALTAVDVATPATAEAAPLTPVTKPSTSALTQRAAIAAAARRLLGVPYRYGGTTPKGFDCSGFIAHVYAKAGADKLPRVSADQARSGRRIPLSQLRVGDLVAYNNSGRNRGADHVALYLGRGKVIESPRPGLSVRIRTLNSDGYDRNAWGVAMKLGLATTRPAARASRPAPDATWRAPLARLTRVSQGFGVPGQYASGRHTGVDYAAPTGTRVLAARAGTVTEAGSGGAYGLNVTVDHAAGYETRYAHLSRLAVIAGTKVRAGQLVGLVGSTGNSTGPHLHFEVTRNGEHVNPTGVVPNRRTRTIATKPKAVERVAAVLKTRSVPVTPAPATGGSQSRTVRTGDTLWELAGKNWLAVYKKNRAALDAAARAHGRSSSGGGHWIYPGTRVAVS